MAKALAALVMVVLAFGAVGLVQQSAPVYASSHSADRSFSAPWVAPGSELEVTVAVRAYGAIGQLVETLPDGFSYVSSNLQDAAVAVEGQTVRFTLIGDESVTYTVAAATVEGSYAFSGILKDADLAEERVGGASEVRVGQQEVDKPMPTPEPVETPTPTRTPTVTPTHEPTKTPAQMPAVTPTPEPGNTPAPTVTSSPEPTPVAGSGGGCNAPIPGSQPPPGAMAGNLFMLLAPLAMIGGLRWQAGRKRSGGPGITDSPSEDSGRHRLESTRQPSGRR